MPPSAPVLPALPAAPNLAEHASRDFHDTTDGEPATPAARPGARSLFALLAVLACVTAADLLLKRGAADAHATADHTLLATLGVTALASPYTIAGILFHLGGLAAWLYTLRHVPLTVAYCFTAVQQATIALGAWLWLHEFISPARWAGIAIVVAGVFILVPSIVQSERRSAAPPGKEDAA